MRAEDLKKAVFDGLTLVRECLTETRERLTPMRKCLKWVVEILKSINDGLMLFDFLYKGGWFSWPAAMEFFQLVGLLGASICAIRGKKKSPADPADVRRYVFSVSIWVVIGKRKSPADAADVRRYVFSVSIWVVGGVRLM